MQATSALMSLNFARLAQWLIDMRICPTISPDDLIIYLFIYLMRMSPRGKKWIILTYLQSVVHNILLRHLQSDRSY